MHKASTVPGSNKQLNAAAVDRAEIFDRQIQRFPGIAALIRSISRRLCLVALHHLLSCMQLMPSKAHFEASTSCLRNRASVVVAACCHCWVMNDVAVFSWGTLVVFAHVRLGFVAWSNLYRAAVRVAGAGGCCTMVRDGRQLAPRVVAHSPVAQMAGDRVLLADVLTR